VNARTRLIVIALAALLGVAATLALGRWQLQRAAQKEALLAAMEAGARLPEIDGRSLQAHKDLLALVYRSARLSGHWLGQYTVYLDNRVMNGKTGFVVVTPLQLEGREEAVLVQRGWLQRDLVDPTRVPVVPTPDGLVEVQGRIALPPSHYLELSHSEPAGAAGGPGGAGSSRIRQNLDHNAFAGEIRRPLLGVSLQQTGAASEGLLREWAAPNLGIERHYGYAFQWFSLAALIALLFVWFQLIAPHVRKRSVP
jgi:cytochrome oxidase assembly protein ShyY1